MLLCFCSLRGLAEQRDPMQGEMLYSVRASEYCLERKGGYCLVLSNGLADTLNHVGNDPSLL